MAGEIIQRVDLQWDSKSAEHSISDFGKNVEKQFNRMQFDPVKQFNKDLDIAKKNVEELEKKIKDARDKGTLDFSTEETTSRMKDINSQIEDLQKQTDKLKSFNKSLENVGKQGTGAYFTNEAEINTNLKTINQLTEEYNKLKESTQVAFEGSEEERALTEELERQKHVVDALTSSFQQMLKSASPQELKTSLNDLKSRLEIVTKNASDAVASGNNDQSIYWGKRMIELKDQIAEVENALKKHIPDSENNINNTIKNIVSNLGRLASGIARRGLQTVINLGRKAVGIFNNLGKASNSAFDLKKILGYAIGIRSLYSVFSKLRSAASQGFNYLTTYYKNHFPALKRSIDKINLSFAQMKASVATAVAPLAQTLAPVIVRIASYFTMAANAVARFFAVLTGQKKVTQVRKDFAKLNDTIEKTNNSLAEFDDLDVLDNGGNDDNVGGIDVGSMFEEIDAFSDLADMIKDAWNSDDVLSAFEEVGKYIGEALKKALDNALETFWPAAQAFAGKLAHALAGTINGFVSVSGLAESIGKTIAAAINTGLQFLSNFWNGVKWVDVGKFLYDGITSAINNVSWANLASYLTGKINGLIDLAWATIGDGGWITSAWQHLSKLFNDVITDVDWGKLGSTLNTSIKDLLEGAKNFLHDNHDDIVASIKKFLEELKIDELIQELWELIKEGISLAWDTAIATLQSSGWLGTILLSWLLVELGKMFIGNAISDLIASGLTGALTTGVTSIIGGGLLTGVLSLLGLTVAGNIVTGMDNAMRENTPYISGRISGVMQEAVEGADGQIYAKGWDGGLTLVQGSQAGIGENGYLVTDEVTGLSYLITAEAMRTGEEVNGIIAHHAVNGRIILEDTNAQIESNTADTTSKLYEYWSTKITESELTVSEKTSAMQDLINALNQTTTEDTNTALQQLANKYNLEFGNAETTVDQKSSNIEKDVKEMSTNVANDSEEGMKKVSETTKTNLEEAETVTTTATQKIIEAISSAAETAASVVIKPRVDTSAIDSAISKLNSLRSAMSSGGGGVSVRGGVSAVPMASGGVLPPNQPFLAMLGDQRHGTNIEAPLDTIVQAMEQALGRSNYTGNQQIVLNIDGTELARLTVPNTLNELNRQGYNVKVLNSK